jgi:hypothetical protein
LIFKTCIITIINTILRQLAAILLFKTKGNGERR